MKKIILSISLFGSVFAGLQAQSPSYNMESWTNVQFSSTQQDPTGWASFNVLVAAGMQQTVFKETTAPYEATTSARIETKQVQGTSVPGYDTVGLLVLGEIQIIPSQTIKYGTEFTGRPASVSFATKFDPATAPNPVDTGWVLVQLTKWNTVTNKADTIASGKYSTTTENLSWTLQTINLVPSYTMPAVSPDTLKIYCSSSSFYRPSVGSKLWVDAFSFNGWVSTNDIDGSVNNVSVYPNPANNKVSIECSVAAEAIYVTDITGRLAGSYSMLNNKADISSEAFASGIYIYRILDAQQKVIARGKFEVAH